MQLSRSEKRKQKWQTLSVSRCDGKAMSRFEETGTCDDIEDVGILQLDDIHCLRIRKDQI